MSNCNLCGKEPKREVMCRLTNNTICMSCCFSISSGDEIINKVRKDTGLTKEDILAKCAACIQEKTGK